MSNTPQPGRLIEQNEVQRDAIHVALAPATAAVRLTPGQHVGLIRSDDPNFVGPTDRNIGIVDPFLTANVEAGQRFWLFLYPNSVTGLRHIWTHPAYTAVAANIRADENEEQSSEPLSSSRSLREDFLEALAENEDDVDTRMVFADWLDEKGEHDEAERHRKWPASKKWLLDFVVKNNHDEDKEDPYETQITYDSLMEFAMRAIVEDDFWFSCGSNMTMYEALYENINEFWANACVILGVDIPVDAAEKSTFKCAC